MPMEFIAATYIGSFNNKELILDVYDEVNRYFAREDLPVRMLFVGKLSIPPGYLINLQTEKGTLKLYPLEAILDALHSKLLQEVETKGSIRMNKIFALVSFPLVSRNPYFDFYEQFFGVQEEKVGLRMMVLSVKPFEPGVSELGVGDPLRIKETFKERLVKGVLHEIGHSFGLSHCRNNCVMNPPANMREWDERMVGYCDSCFLDIKRKLSLMEFEFEEGC